MKKIFIASDHAGYSLKEAIKKKFNKKFKFEDLGTNSQDISVNYPDYAHNLCKKVAIKKNNIGIKDFQWFGFFIERTKINFELA